MSYPRQLMDDWEGTPRAEPPRLVHAIQPNATDATVTVTSQCSFRTIIYGSYRPASVEAASILSRKDLLQRISLARDSQGTSLLYSTS